MHLNLSKLIQFGFQFDWIIVARCHHKMLTFVYSNGKLNIVPNYFWSTANVCKRVAAMFQNVDDILFFAVITYSQNTITVLYVVERMLCFFDMAKKEKYKM